MEGFEEFTAEVLTEIRANLHKYPSVCRMLLSKTDRLEAENAQLRLEVGVAIPKSVKYRHMEETIESLTSERLTMLGRIAELEGKLDREFIAKCNEMVDRAYTGLRAGLEAATLRAERLEEALERIAEFTFDWDERAVPTELVINQIAKEALAAEKGEG